jgi:translocation and assembly module TamB
MIAPIPDNSNQPDDDDIEERGGKKKRKILLILGAVSLVSLGGGAIYGWYFLHNKLVPLVETALSDYLDRPVKVGELQSFSPSGATIGKSEIPATPTDTDRATIESVEVKYDLWRFVTTRELNLDINLENPDIYLEQEKNNVWVGTKLKSDDGKESAIKVKVHNINLTNADVTLVASDGQKPKTPVKANLDKVNLNVLDNLLKVDLTGKFDRGGNIQLQGDIVPKKEDITLNIQAQQITATEITNFLKLPLKISAGKVDGDLVVKLTDDPTPYLKGSIDLINVTAAIVKLPQAFSQANGKINFDGSVVGFENVTTSFGKVAGKVNGNLDVEKDFNIIAEIKQTNLNNVLDSLKIKKPELPIDANIKGVVKVSGEIEKPTVSVAFATTKQSKIDKLAFNSIDGNLELSGTNLYVRNFTALPQLGGKIVGSGTVNFSQKVPNVTFNVQGSSLPGNAIANAYNSNLPTDIGLVSLTTQITGKADSVRNLRFTGNASFPIFDGTVNASNINYTNDRWQANIKATNLDLNSQIKQSNKNANIPSIKVNNTNLVVAGSVENVNANNLQVAGTANLDVSGNNVSANNIALNNGNWSANIITDNFNADRYICTQNSQNNGCSDNFGGITSNLQVAGNLQDTSIDNISIKGKAIVPVAGGTVTANNLNVSNGNWQANISTNDVKVRRLTPAIPQELAGTVDGNFIAAGNLNNTAVDRLNVRGNASLTTDAGVFEANNLALQQGQFQAVLVPKGVELNRLAGDVRGKLAGELMVAGNLNNLNLGGIQANGNLNFSRGISVVDRPLNTTVNWNGDRLDVPKITGEGILANGFFDVDTKLLTQAKDKLTAITNFVLNIEKANSIDLASLPVRLPSFLTPPSLTPKGTTDFQGKLSGNIKNPDINGDVAVNNLTAGGVEFEPKISGKINSVRGKGLDLQLAGNNDRLDLNINGKNELQSFNVVQGEKVLRGTGEGTTVNLEVDKIPLTLVRKFAVANKMPVPPAVTDNNIGGDLAGNFIFKGDNPNKLAVDGNNLVVTQPVLGKIKADRLTGNFQYIDGDLTLQQVEIAKRNITSQIEGSLKQTPSGAFLDGSMALRSIPIQEVLETLEIFELSDFAKVFQEREYAKAEDLYTDKPTGENIPLVSVGNPDATIGRQLQRFVEISTLFDRQRQEREQASLFPELRLLQGNFDGDIQVSGLLPEGVKSTFSFTGNNWQWGDYAADRVVTQGTFENGILTMLPVGLAFQDSIMSVSAIVGGETPTGQVKLVNVPVSLVEKFVKLPPSIGFGGKINATANLAGTFANPSAKGEIVVDNATINETAITNTQGSFNYDNARLDFFATSLIKPDTDPLTITGSLPYPLPFAKVEPDSDKLDLNLNLKDEGLTLLDILTRGQVNWIDGKGEVSLDIEGIFDAELGQVRRLKATGITTINNATIGAQILPDAPLTEVNGRILFDFDRINVEQITGKFSGGDVFVSGSLPLANKQPQEQPLVITLDKLALQLQGLYEGGVDGNIIITGSATQPEIGGDLALTDGQIILTDSNANSGNSSNNNSNNNNSDDDRDKDNSFPVTDGNGNPVNGINNIVIDNNSLAAVTRFNALKVTLGDNIQITKQPILNFVAEGDLTVYGTLIQPTPEGTIRLKRGQVNIFTTQLNLAADDNNIARFSIDRGLDPYLSVRLIGSAVETIRNPLSNDPFSSEISDIPATNLGILQTIRIQAEVEGQASQLTNSIELTSSPPRNKTEIVSLLGGGFVTNLGRGDSTLGLANLAGSALFGTFNTAVTNALGLSEFRLFPTQISDKDNRDVILGLAAEASIDLANNFSFSVLKILNGDIPAQFGLRYRIDDSMVIRGSSNFDDESRIILEYEQRF